MKKFVLIILGFIFYGVFISFAQVLYNSDFEADITGWVSQSLSGTAPANQFTRNTIAGHSTTGFTIPVLANSTYSVAYNDMKNSAIAEADEYFRTTTLDLTIYDSVAVFFSYFSVNQVSGTNLSSLFFVNKTNNVGDFANTLYWNLPSQAGWNNVYIVLSPSQYSATTLMGFNFYDLSSGNTQGGLAIDNIQIIGYRTSTNDNCVNAVNLTPGTTCTPISGDLSGNTNSGLPTTCGGNPSNDVWFQFTATSQQAVILAQASFLYDLDLVMEIYSGSCGSLTPIGCIDQDDITQSNATGLEEFLYGNYTIGETYYVRLYNFYGNTYKGDFQICIQNIPSCSLAAVISDLPEPETCGVAANNSCATGTPIACGDTYRGTISAGAGSRDLDYYTFTVVQNTPVTITLESEFYGYVVLYNAANCSAPTFIDGYYSAGCTLTTITETLAPGNYAILVAPDGFYGYGCSQTNIGYRLNLNMGTVAAPTITAQSATTICPGGNVVLQTTATGTYQWYESGNAISGATASTYNATAAGSYTVKVSDVNGCSSVSSNIITVTVSSPAAPTISASGSTNFCPGGSVVLSAAGVGSTFQWYEGTTAIPGASSSTLTVTSAGSYSVEEIVGGCTSARSSATTVTIDPLDNANFTYSPSTICAGAANITPTVITPGGTFSVTPNTLVFVDASTGEIDVTGSVNGVYTITYTTAGTCPNSSSSTFTITSAPDASFTYSNPEYCKNVSNPLPVFTTGSAGVFSSTTGLVINSNTGEVDLALSSPGVYTVTNSIAASGSCAATSANAQIEVLEVPTATVSGGGSICGSSTATVTVTLTGAGPWEFDLSDGTNVIPVTNVGTTPYTYTATAAGIYTIANLSDGNCLGTTTGSAIVTTGVGYTSQNNQTICPGGSYQINGNTYTLAGTYRDTVVALDGCDSVIVTDLSITNINIGVTKAGFTLTASQAGAMYEWIDCATNTPVVGATSQSFTPSANGQYKVKITVGTCTETSTCTDVQGININEAFATHVNVFPNPATDFVTVDAGAFTIDRVAIVNLEGRVLSLVNVGANTTLIDLSMVSDGMYFMYIYSSENMVIKKLIKK